ncbi:exosortase F system-associated membrane protein [Autumnicola edwardsiae]|uniref:Exosortase F system-associated protein n=1 Tax=Autumnicola edwardsiae TaxID=3075594 RepID=A0ABU3CXC2_9FLAO|nr:exosortase F system-associated protein [Zunongwangia sp. F297]MDT0651017.1 exosortase F system-associated protein [Zunongwangia sp. F297]
MKQKRKITGISVLVVLLVMVRYFENELFYDPLIHFYQRDYLHSQIPKFDFWPLVLNVFLRFTVNTTISLAIIYVAFLDKNILKFSALLYGILFILAGSIFIYLLLNIENEHFLALFYVRRFLIHPVFILILLPAFYYYRLRNRNSGEIESFSKNT